MEVMVHLAQEEQAVVVMQLHRELELLGLQILVVAGAVLGVRQAVQAGQVLWLLLTHQLVNEAQAAQ